MKTRFRFATLAIAAVGASFASADLRTQLDVIRNGAFSGTYGAYVLGETEPTTASGPTNPTRNAGPFATSPNKVGLPTGANRFFVAGVSNGSFDNAGGTTVNGKQDLLSFTVNEDPSTYGVIDVVRRRIATASGVGAISVTQFGVNSVANDGRIALKMTTGISGNNSSGFGLIPATNTSVVAFETAGASNSSVNEYTPSSGTGYTFLGTSGTVTFSVPSIGAFNDLVLDTNFNKQITASLPTYTNGTYLPTTRVAATIAAANVDNRGSITYNDTAGLAAVLRLKQTATAGTTAINHATAVAIYRVSVDGSGNVVLRDLAGNASATGTEIALPTAVSTEGGKSLDLVGTNYFSRSNFVGPVQIAMNDNGDIALTTVAIDTTDTTDTSQNQERGSRNDHRVLVNRFSGAAFTGWLTAARSGANVQGTDANGNLVENPGTGDFVTVDPAAPGTYSIATGSPSLDNDGNVYFAAATQAVVFTSGGTTVRSAIFRAAPLISGYAAVQRVLQEGDVLEDPINLTDQTVTFLPLPQATSDLTNANIRYPADNAVNPNSAFRDAQGGLIFACRLSDASGDTTLPTRWSFVYLSFR